MTNPKTRPIVIGNTEKGPQIIDLKKINYHTCVLGQSGSGKSFTLSRYLEEILLSDAGQIILFDFNYEYSKFNDINPSNFSSSFNLKCCEEDDLSNFTDKWTKLNYKIHSNRSSELKINLSDLKKEEINLLINIDPKVRPGAYWLLELITMDDLVKAELPCKNGIKNLLSMLERWAEGRLKSDEIRFGDRPKEVKNLTNSIDIVQIKNGLNYLQNKENILTYPKKLNAFDIEINKNLIDIFFNDYNFYSLDFLNFDYDLYPIRDFIFYYFLKLLWKKSKQRYIDAFDKNKTTELKPIFIVIDEVHNVIPKDLSSEIISILQTIASEGRKFKIFLIIATQNPEKINANIFSECDNFIFMKSNQKASEFFEKTQGLETDSVRKEIKKFIVGDAFMFGQFSDYELIKIKSSIKRTK